jgi:hypothetical protein
MIGAYSLQQTSNGAPSGMSNPPQIFVSSLNLTTSTERF